MLPHPLTNFEIQNCYRNEPKFNGACSRNNLPKIKDETYITNIDEYESIGAHWIALYVNRDNVLYFDSFGVKHIPIEIRKFIENENIVTNIYSCILVIVFAYDSIMCRYFCIGIIDFMLKGKRSSEYTNLFSQNEYEKNDK